MRHKPITTLAEWDELDRTECMAGYLETNPGDLEPGANQSRSYHHGWRMRMFDMGEIETPVEHRRLVREIVDRERVARGEKPKGPWGEPQ